ncbi:hypothetical protein AVEN_268416-1 [Araneus ventricosus]|uniref:Uncharacterized protein n=1 Tax=Araneus ventricosus TaxID=182803 RepID=A0A4Y2DWW5_ARAVE|nr:hypothetical protein AVEN_268416-1 [Araneus ventricosus]
MVDRQRNLLLNLESSGPEAETLPLDHRVPITSGSVNPSTFHMPTQYGALCVKLDIHCQNTPRKWCGSTPQHSNFQPIHLRGESGRDFVLFPFVRALLPPPKVAFMIQHSKWISNEVEKITYQISSFYLIEVLGYRVRRRTDRVDYLNLNSRQSGIWVGGRVIKPGQKDEKRAL